MLGTLCGDVPVSRMRRKFLVFGLNATFLDLFWRSGEDRSQSANQGLILL